MGIFSRLGKGELEDFPGKNSPGKDSKKRKNPGKMGGKRGKKRRKKGENGNFFQGWERVIGGFPGKNS